MKRLLPALLLVLAGCFARVRDPGAHDEGPGMSRAEAERRGLEYCVARGFTCRLKDSDRQGHRYKVALRVERPVPGGEIALEFDRRNHQPIKAKEKVARD